ncbi:TRIAP1/MDM35 family protein [Mesobacillus foraminis]|nr:TRIAP1/MDM35 family protein [Mesobacillus foraminis]
MVETEEVLIIIEELGRLFKDYKKCNDKRIRRQIIEDIRLLGEAIDPNH